MIKKIEYILQKTSAAGIVDYLFLMNVAKKNAKKLASYK
jgi:hypothetical protein